MEISAKEVLNLPMDQKGRVLIPAEERKKHDLEKGDSVEIAVLGKN